MTHRRRLIIASLAGLAGSAASAAGAASPPALKRPPNIVVILADDLGYADLGCYGNPGKPTPRLDKMAREGMRFTDFHANGPMCSPTRAAFLTGRYPQRVGIESALPIMEFPAERHGLPAKTVTLAQHLRAAGYETGLFGKWHLGHHPDENPVRFGFGEFRGLICSEGDYSAQINRAGLPDWWENEVLKPEKQPGNTTRLITDYSIQFIQRNKARPFFLFVSHAAIHFPWMRSSDEPHRKLGKGYYGITNPADSRLGPHVGGPELREVVQEMIGDVDRSTGRILDPLRQLGLEGDTLVIFTSDNGGYLEYQGRYRGEISNHGAYQGGKMSLFEGGHRVPAIARWPGQIPAGRTSAAVAMTMDIVPTALELAGVPLPETKVLHPDGVSLVKHLQKEDALPERSVFWRFRGRRAVRSGPWKLHLSKENAPALFRLDQDPGETRNLAKTEPAIVERLTREITEWERDVDRSLANIGRTP
ncbi:sulfatase-like hydrolase/transferase [Ereboglobus luteus]|uniref:Sulfatase N-terminal domain-containing protein n=1 Tax=Ereboglobus luteus TaxID=1796921 RepID=A0A2U8E4S9_9BACT|nr:sulfatase-like hydrolase/transferase [Ereboglobus luteus]AWI09948.1 hypothetical protein CKA38_12450 [Ereboglobus luteus]